MQKPASEAQIHATAIAQDGRAIVLRGPSGAGKSDLALRLITLGWTLIADDRCDLNSREGRVIVSCPAPLLGKIEARGIGILDAPNDSEAHVVLVCDLAPGPHDRLPEIETEEILGQAIRRITLDPFEGSAAAKLTLLMQMLKL